MVKSNPIYINTFSRYQKGLSMEDLYPVKRDKVCSCGCGQKLTSRKRRWFSKDCLNKSLTHFFIVKGDVSIIRKEVFKRDNGFCCICGVFDSQWHADHIVAVINGGGGCDLNNFQTLCVPCHKLKTKSDLSNI